MKTIEVTVRRVTYTTYDVEVADDFDANAEGVYKQLEDSYFDGEWGYEGALPSFEEVANWEIDDLQDNNDNEEN